MKMSKFNFLDYEMKKKTYFWVKIPIIFLLYQEKVRSRTGLGLAIGCGVLGLVLGTASIAFAFQRIMAAKAAAKADDMEGLLPKPDMP